MTTITNGVSISVETFFQPDFSNPLGSDYLFAYRITIENLNNFPIKLHSRHWHIFDSNGTYREVEGEGVVGAQPTVNPGESYNYMSGCNLKTEMGKMFGEYLMEDLDKKRKFRVKIPAFEMVVPTKLN